MTLTHFLFWIKYKGPECKPAKLSEHVWRAMVRHYNANREHYEGERQIGK